MASLSEKFNERFTGSPHAHGTYTIKQSSGTSPKKNGIAKTISGPPTKDLWQAHLQGDQSLGVIPVNGTGFCRWGALDIDEYDLDLNALTEKLNDYPVVLCETKSGGAHIFFFFSEDVDAGLVRRRLAEFSGFIGHGGCEVFPKQVISEAQAVGNWLNMPYFGNTRKARVLVSGKIRELTPQEFLKQAKRRAITAADLQALELSLGEGQFNDGPPCLETMMASGGFPEGQRNSGLYNVGIYMRLKHPDTWEDELASFNFNGPVDPPLPNIEVQTLIKSLSRKADYFYQCDKEPLCSSCNKQLCKTRKFGVGSEASEDLDVLFSGIQKVDSDPALWILEVETHALVLTTDEVMNWRAIQKKAMEKLNRLLPAIKPGKWAKILNRLLENVEVIQAPEDVGIAGQIMDLFETFVRDRATEDKHQINVGKVWVNEGKVWFKSSAFMHYLNQHRSMFNKTIVYNALRQNLGEFDSNTRKTIAGHKSTIWIVPYKLDDPANLPDLPVPRVQGEF